jgi:hypothetical protein
MMYVQGAMMEAGSVAPIPHLVTPAVNGEAPTLVSNQISQISSWCSSKSCAQIPGDGDIDSLAGPFLIAGRSLDVWNKTYLT